MIFTYDGSRSEKGFRIYINGNMVPSYGTGEDLAPLETSIRTTTSPLYLGNRGKEFFEGGNHRIDLWRRRRCVDEKLLRGLLEGQALGRVCGHLRLNLTGEIVDGLFEIRIVARETGDRWASEPKAIAFARSATCCTALDHGM